jgi:penicillin-binding protein 1A
MVRAQMEERVGEAAYTAGFTVYTSAHSRLQQAANAALREALIDYDRRHGFRGPELRVEPGASADAAARAVADIPAVGGLQAGVVVSVEGQTAAVLTDRFGEIAIGWEGLSWARPYIDENRRGEEPKQAADILAPGDVVRVEPFEEGWRLAQVPDVEGAIVALDPADGAIVALAGGFDFFRSKFNRATQAQRQPGSSFKPFIYSSALEKGFTPASLVNDAPVVFDDPGLEAAWRPENYSGKFFGPTRLRVALYKSRNLVSIRLLQAVGVEHAIAHASRFGFDVGRLPRNLSLALGSGAVSPLELARAYAVLANGGYLVEPYFVDSVVDARGEVTRRASPLRVCRECAEDVLAPQAPARGPDGVPVVAPAPSEPTLEPTSPAFAPRVVSRENVWLMGSMMRDVVKRGTARRARALERSDLAGKTGTTNDQRDAWFSGFNARLVATAWVGFDTLRPLGRSETGGRAALPMWIDFMRVGLEGVPEEIAEQPEGRVTVRINPQSGKPAAAGEPDAIFETFVVGTAPAAEPRRATAAARQTEAAPAQGGGGEVTEQLF